MNILPRFPVKLTLFQFSKAYLDQHVVVMVATAIIYHGYKPVKLTAEEKDLFHPELHKWLDGVKHRREDYIIYLDFLEAAIEHLSKDSRCCG